MRRRLFLTGVATLATAPLATAPLATAPLATAPVHAATIWQMATEYPATSMPGEGVSHFAAQVRALSASTIDVQPRFDAPDGLRSADMLLAVGDGSFAAADAFTGALGGVAPLFQLSALPFLTQSAADTVRLLEAARPAYCAVLAERCLTLLYATPWPATGLWSRTPIVDPAALRGLRVRTYDPAGTAVFRTAGAAPTQLSFADALPRLRDGSLDAVLSSGDGGAGARLWDVLPYFTRLDYAAPLSLAFCSTAALSALPPDLQDLVVRAALATEGRQFDAIAGRTAENDVRMAANSVTVQAAPAVRTALLVASGLVIADWVERAGPAAAAALAAYRPA